MAQLAQLNIARMKYSYEGPEMRDFVNALDSVNASADKSPGFVWRLVSEEESSEDIRSFEERGWIVNMSVWQGLQELKDFISSPLHLSIMRRRAEWFEKSEQPTMVLWWVDDGHLPGFSEAIERLEHLRVHGASKYAFGFSRPFEFTGATAVK